MCFVYLKARELAFYTNAVAPWTGRNAQKPYAILKPTVQTWESFPEREYFQKRSRRVSGFENPALEKKSKIQPNREQGT